ncbi:hypothetical protein O3M35_008765 [Rhynocoris fuscipes]|uniref:Uncharacterized protein n=1 Tax=Rhynocoris fuscipes TaxID=488301 RepID=A0AAW1D8P6_9HEMI
MELIWAYILAKLWASVMAFVIIITYRAFLFFDIVFTFQISTCITILRNYLETNGVEDKRIYKQHRVLIQ